MRLNWSGFWPSQVFHLLFKRLMACNTPVSSLMHTFIKNALWRFFFHFFILLRAEFRLIVAHTHSWQIIPQKNCQVEAFSRPKMLKCPTKGMIFDDDSNSKHDIVLCVGIVRIFDWWSPLNWCSVIQVYMMGHVAWVLKVSHVWSFAINTGRESVLRPIRELIRT